MNCEFECDEKQKEIHPEQDFEELINNMMNCRLDREHAKKGILNASLIWNDIADLDLHCMTPSGEHICFMDRNSTCGGMLDVDMNSNRMFASLEPVENIVWEKEPPKGKYTFFVENFHCWSDDRFPDSKRSVEFCLRIMTNQKIHIWNGVIHHKDKSQMYEIMIE